ncbi:MAG: lysine--tRNA ligase [Actinomycetota bacterium]|nr:lysine--tRNA ligase [Rubrobacteraceae bacterium]MBA3637359.1 lysine--tRNA ligase [Rubrobacteraceae bacterium]MBA3703603.1 lysine--tRNA ligase [Rubrobacteraceae bacterium]MDQ3496749.1 lysine--tRNA ligase [Actinomycetota bacterium]
MSETGRSTGIHIPGWAERVADSLGAGPHVVVSGISVSGNIHAGNLREVLVAEAVANALRQRGEEVRFIFHADTIDPLRKIAPGIPQSYEEFIGHSLSHIPDPEGCHVSYAEHFLVPFEEALLEMGMDIEVLRSHDLYERGVYTDVTREAIEHTDGLREILQEVTNRKMPEHWSPYLPRASSGKLIGRRVLEHLPEQTSVVFADEDGFEEAANYSKGEGKLGWRVELAARWKALGITFEPFGKDHTSRGGSTDTADRMSSEVFHYPVPGRYEYEWIGLKGRGDMSSSRGIVLLPKDLLEIMPPDAVRRIILGRDPARRFDIDLEGGFPRFMDEYRAEAGEPYVPFTHLVTVAQTVGEDPDAAAEMLRRGGYGEAARDTDKLAQDLYYARNWAAEWAPESMRLGLLDQAESEEAAAGLDDEQRAYLREVSGKLQAEMDGEAVQDVLYSTAIERGLKPKRAFAAVYRVLLGKSSGPKAGPFIAGLTLDQARERLSV